MEHAMSRQNICYFADPLVQDMHRATCLLVRLFRAAGHKNEHAIQQAALALGVTPRRAWNFRYLTQPVRVLRQQRDLALHRAWTAMDREAAKLRAHADQIERQAEAARIAEMQFSLPLWGGDECSEPHTPRSVFGDGGRR